LRGRLFRDEADDEPDAVAERGDEAVEDRDAGTMGRGEASQQHRLAHESAADNLVRCVVLLYAGYVLGDNGDVTRASWCSRGGLGV